MTSRDLAVVVVAAGLGTRLGADKPKAFVTLAEKTLIQHALENIAEVPALEQVILAVPAGHESQTAAIVESALAGKNVRYDVVVGGDTRQQSIANALKVIDPEVAVVLVHDAARCLITELEINRLIDACLDDEVGGLLALPLPDTLKAATNGRVSATLPRQDKWLAQTPQMFRAGALHAALKAQAADHFEGITDEASAMEMAGFAPKLVVGSPHNFKVTYPPDFALAEDLLGSRK